MTKEVEFEWHQDSWLQVDLEDLLQKAAEDGLHVVELTLPGNNNPVVLTTLAFRRRLVAWDLLTAEDCKGVTRRLVTPRLTRGKFFDPITDPEINHLSEDTDWLKASFSYARAQELSQKLEEVEHHAQETFSVKVRGIGFGEPQPDPEPDEGFGGVLEPEEPKPQQLTLQDTYVPGYPLQTFERVWYPNCRSGLDVEITLVDAGYGGGYMVTYCIADSASEAMTARERVFWIPPWSSTLGKIAESQLGVKDETLIEYQESAGIFWTYIRRV